MSPSQTSGPVLWSIDERAVGRLVLNRPQVNNAYDGALESLLAALDALARVKTLRAVVITGNGRHFQVGADLGWIDAVRQASGEENTRVSRTTALAVRKLNAAPVPTVALVQGGCFGGGTGIIAACDVVIAAADAMFSIAEVRRGLIAAIIIPRLNHAIGVRQVRRYALTGERFGAPRRGASGWRTRSYRPPSSRPSASASSTICSPADPRRSARPSRRRWPSAGAISTRRRSTSWSRRMRRSAVRRRRQRDLRRSPRKRAARW